MDEKEKRDLLKSEYFHLQSTIEGYDQKALTIKAWSLTSSLAAIALSFSDKSPSAPLLLIAILSSFIFWLIEGMWKKAQDSYFDRINLIEAYFSGTNKTIVPMQIGETWTKNFTRGGYKYSRLLTIMCYPRVFLPHGFVLLIGILMLLAAKQG